MQFASTLLAWGSEYRYFVTMRFGVDEVEDVGGAGEMACARHEPIGLQEKG